MIKDKNYYLAVADRSQEILGAADPLRFQEAFDVMKLETKSVDKEEARYTEIKMMAELGMAQADALLTKLEAQLPERVARSIQTVGINLALTETKAVLTQLKDASAITQGEYDTMMALTKEQAHSWPGLRAGEVQNALQLRAGGHI